MGTSSTEAAPGTLSRRELEVAKLVAEGLTNREIANRLFISERTVDGHLEHVREKLHVNTRAQVATWVARQGTAAPVTVPRAQGRATVPGLRVWLAAAIAFAVVALTVISLLREPPGPTIVTIAGTQPINPAFPKGTFSGDGAPATSAELQRPSDIVAGPGGVIYIADIGNHRVRVVRRDHTIDTIAGGGTKPLTTDSLAREIGIDFPSAVAVDNVNQVYVLTNQDGAAEVWSVGADTYMRRLVSLPASGYRPSPYWADPVGGLAVAGDGSLYIADRAGNQVWSFKTGQGLVRIAGTEEPGFSGDNGPAATALLDSPVGLALDESAGTSTSPTAVTTAFAGSISKPDSSPPSPAVATPSAAVVTAGRRQKHSSRSPSELLLAAMAPSSSPTPATTEFAR